MYVYVYTDPRGSQSTKCNPLLRAPLVMRRGELVGGGITKDPVIFLQQSLSGWLDILEGRAMQATPLIPQHGASFPNPEGPAAVAQLHLVIPWCCLPCPSQMLVSYRVKSQSILQHLLNRLTTGYLLFGVQGWGWVPLRTTIHLGRLEHVVLPWCKCFP